MKTCNKVEAVAAVEGAVEARVLNAGGVLGSVALSFNKVAAVAALISDCNCCDDREVVLRQDLSNLKLHQSSFDSSRQLKI